MFVAWYNNPVSVPRGSGILNAHFRGVLYTNGVSVIILSVY